MKGVWIFMIVSYFVITYVGKDAPEDTLEKAKEKGKAYGEGDGEAYYLKKKAFRDKMYDYLFGE